MTQGIFSLDNISTHSHNLALVYSPALKLHRALHSLPLGEEKGRDMQLLLKEEQAGCIEVVLVP